MSIAAGTKSASPETRTTIFDDPDRSADESREIIVGHSREQRLLIVSFTERCGRVRIISARAATRRERHDYEQAVDPRVALATTQRSSFEPGRTVATDTVERVHVERMGVVAMDLPATEAFPLFSAEGERRWVAGWDPCYVHPIEPGAGEGVIFRTTNKGVGTATWIQTRHDPATGVASFVYMVPDHHAAMVDVHVTPEGEGRSRASVKYRMTSLSSAADDFVRAFGETFDDYMRDWAEAIQRHIVEGVPLRR